MAGFDSKHVMIDWDEGAGAVAMQWKRPAQYQAFREGLDAAIAVVGECSAKRLVADHSMLNLPDEDDAHFKQWVPKLARAGVQRLAVIVERRQFVQIPKTRLAQRLKSGALVMHYFSDMDQAKIWLADQKAA